MKSLSYYPVDEQVGVELVTTSVQLPSDLHANIEFTARLWNALDEARGVNRRYKWKVASVIRRLCLVGTTGVSDGLGGIPAEKEAQDALIELTAEKLRTSLASAKSKK